MVTRPNEPRTLFCLLICFIAEKRISSNLSEYTAFSD